MAKRRKKLAVVKTFPAPKVQPAWTPISVFEEFIADMKAGKIKPEKTMIFYLETNAAGRLIPHYWCQSISTAEQIAFGELIKHLAMQDWQEP